MLLMLLMPLWMLGRAAGDRSTAITQAYQTTRCREQLPLIGK